VETHQRAKFCQNRSISCEDIKISRFFKMAAADILYFRNREFFLLLVSAGPRRITVPNFVNIGRSIAEILHFFEFSRWPPPPSGIFEIVKLYWLFWSRVWRRISTPNFVKISQLVAKRLRFFVFSRRRPSPS